MVGGARTTEWFYNSLACEVTDSGNTIKTSGKRSPKTHPQLLLITMGVAKENKGKRSEMVT